MSGSEVKQVVILDAELDTRACNDDNLNTRVDNVYEVCSVCNRKAFVSNRPPLRLEGKDC